MVEREGRIIKPTFLILINEWIKEKEAKSGFKWITI
jgi:hypothetical protein